MRKLFSGHFLSSTGRRPALRSTGQPNSAAAHRCWVPPAPSALRLPVSPTLGCTTTTSPQSKCQRQMPRNLNLPPSMAAAVRSALIALSFEQGALHVDFDSIDVFVTEEGWITVRGGEQGFEEYKDLPSFESAYKLQDPAPDLLALAYEMEAMCDSFLISADEEGGKGLAAELWAKRRDRCRAAIASAIAGSTTS